MCSLNYIPNVMIYFCRQILLITILNLSTVGNLFTVFMFTVRNRKELPPFAFPAEIDFTSSLSF